MIGKLNDRDFQLDVYGYSDYFSVIISTYGEEKNIIISITFLPPPSILYDHNVWMSGARDRYIDDNIVTSKLGPLTTLDNIEKDYPQFKDNPKIFYNIIYHAYTLAKSDKNMVGKEYEFSGNSILILNDELLQVK